MVNRIENEIAEIELWKKQVQKPFSARTRNSRAFKAELLSRYEQMLSRKRSDLTRDEKFFLKLAREERKSLLKELYPWRPVRIFRNLFQFGKKVGNAVAGFILGDAVSSLAAQSIKTDLGQRGFDGLDATGKLKEGREAFSETLTESYAEKETVKYDLSFQKGANGRMRLDGYTATSLSNPSKPIKIHVDRDMNINKDQARELLNGRAINTDGNKWVVLDMNDADSHGNTRIREMNIQGYDVSKSVRDLPLKKRSEPEIRKIVEGLADGKRIAIDLVISGVQRKVEVEAAPIKRNLTFFENGTKKSLEEIKGIAKPLGKKNGVDISKMNLPKSRRIGTR